ncbi:hypothetical protein CC85DRAFT_57842 [Cutaneotrichosporon oleaginosum]|uniref:Secreted protein n=1 Tax=Cutaneotrichosporon oleaginosum TaxID=879819 RepID=A0A0J1BDS7_9TREE|nr:uncharacterized protein CC85DRAFT_57842 [Cutaneotrichosporon oleaginosum]KLT46229.1 hypothetical protein CC85DRAFT_57842 [Cutaneotrichosporon oleaginosum]TXT10235.1 hypothetical protein COLE_04169 [Cutaneotrichosporon oleaginosum]
MRNWPLGGRWRSGGMWSSLPRMCFAHLCLGWTDALKAPILHFQLCRHSPIHAIHKLESRDQGRATTALGRQWGTDSMSHGLCVPLCGLDTARAVSRTRAEFSQTWPSSTAFNACARFSS